MNTREEYQKFLNSEFWKNLRSRKLEINPSLLLSRLKQTLSGMTTDELFQTMVDSGIYLPDGRLAKEYGGGDGLCGIAPGLPAKQSG